MKVYYLNDEQKEMTVRVLDLTYDHTYTKSDNRETYHKLKPAEGKLFEVVIPEGSCLWVKKWPGMVMLSYYGGSALQQASQPDEQPQTEEDA